MTRFNIFILSLISAIATVSGAPSFTVKVSPAYVGETFFVVYTVTDASVSKQSISAPAINGCKLLYGPAVNQIQNYSNINGRASSNTQVEFTYTYKALTKGTFTVPAATVDAGGKRMHTNSIKFEVMDAPSGRQSGHNARTQLDDINTQQAGRPISADDVFVRIILSKSTAYEYEAIECTIKLYTKYGVRDFIPTQQPSFDGFIVEDLPIQSSLNQIETVNGDRYFTAELKRCVLFPQKSGKLTIRSGNYDLAVEQYDIIDMALLSVADPRYRKISITSNTASADIKPLPSPRPAGFTGAVGDFKVSERLTSSNFRTNAPASLVYKIEGSGNLRYITDPVIDFPAEFEQYSPEHEVDAQVQGNNVVGSSTTTFTFVPQEPGEYTIVVPDFVYFNPTTAQYVTIPGEKHSLKVARGSGSGAVERRDVEAKNTDILYIHSGIGSLSKTHTYAVTSWWYWLLMVLIPVISAISYKAYMKSRAINARTDKRIGRAAEQSLKKAKLCMTQKKTDEFYQEVSKALYGYIASRLKINIAELSKENIASRLSELHASPELTAELMSLLDDCEVARFSPEAASGNIKEIYSRAASIIGQLSKLKIKK